MNIYPKVYLLRERDDKYEIYFGGFSTLDGIKLLDKNLKIMFEEFGATNYKKFEFATENDIPKLESIEEFIHFLENEDYIDIIHCKIELAEIGKLSTPQKGRIYIHSIYFFKDNGDTIFRITRGGNGIPNFVAKDNYSFGLYADKELKNFIVIDSFKLSSKLILNYKRNFPDSIISDGKTFSESITPLATYKLKNGIPTHIKTDTIWNHWD